MVYYIARASDSISISINQIESLLCNLIFILQHLHKNVGLLKPYNNIGVTNISHYYTFVLLDHFEERTVE